MGVRTYDIPQCVSRHIFSDVLLSVTQHKIFPIAYRLFSRGRCSRIYMECMYTLTWSELHRTSHGTKGYTYLAIFFSFPFRIFFFFVLLILLLLLLLLETVCRLVQQSEWYLIDMKTSILNICIFREGYGVYLCLTRKVHDADRIINFIQKLK